ncbi:TNF receptor-associated factor 4 [Stylophora pistillata]|uniref:TNF receptor-associated factor 4 n=1 Tax=Stylophora pistillata TaxID=50429 RepID=A0A2B4RBL2_STYPI|nr:TNF receptor-associated factor 4 [Stylophora pistillata]
MASLTSTVQGQAQQIQRLTVQVQHQAEKTKEMNKESKGQSDKMAATNVSVDKLDRKKSKGDTMKQVFKPESIKDIEVGMKVLFMNLYRTLRGTVKYVGSVPWQSGDCLRVELDPDQEFPSHANDGTIRGKRYFTCLSFNNAIVPTAFKEAVVDPIMKKDFLDHEVTMAAGQNVPEPGGYDFEFTSKVPDDLECPVCHFAMKDPVQIVRCGHRFCNLCLEGCFSRHSLECPVDRQPFSPDKIFSDIACHRRILNLTAKCSYAGCPWKGELRAVEQHHNVCQKFPVQCTNNCGLRDIPREKFPRASTRGHLDSHVKSHLNLALCNLEITQKQVRDQSKQIERLASTCDDQSQQLNDQSQQIACLTSTVQGLVQQMERLKNKTTNEAMGGANKKGATNVKVKEGGGTGV